MKEHPYTSPLRPGPDCASFIDLLPLLSEETLEEPEALRLRAHLVGCAYCRAQHAAYDQIDVALRQYIGAAATIPFSAEEIMTDPDEEINVHPDEWLPREPAITAPPTALAPRRPRRGWRFVAFMSAVAAVVVVGLVVGGFVALLHPGQGVPGTPSFTDYSWQVVSSPNSAQPVNALSGIAFSSSTDGWAVGTSRDEQPIVPPKEYLPLVEHWNGKAWQMVSTPTLPHGGSLASVISLAADNAWAVGNITTIPNTANNDAYMAPLIEHWDGNGWTVVKSPAMPPQTHSALVKVAALSADDIWAVGWADGRNGLIEHWDGHQWSISPVPSAPSPNQQAQLTSIAALAPDDVWVAGRGLRGADHWDGHQWSFVAGPANIPFLGGMSALSPNDVWEVGFAATKVRDYLAPPERIVLEHWDGQHWSIVNTTQPKLTNLFILSEMIAFGPANIWVFGSQVPPPFLDSPVAQGFIAHWDGTRWTVISNPHPQKCTELLGATSDPSTAGKLWMVGSAGSQCTELDGLSSSTFIETSL